MAEQRKSPAAPVPTPLHLLQGLTRTLNEHLAEACQRAEEDAQKVLDKLAQKRARLDEKTAQAEARLAEARASGGSTDKLEKLDGKLSELREQLAVVAQAHDEAQSYARQLNSDVRQTLRLAKGLARIDAQAGQAIEKRNNPTASTEKRPSSRRSRSRRNNDSEPTPEL